MNMLLICYLTFDVTDLTECFNKRDNVGKGSKTKTKKKQHLMPDV